PSVFSVAGISGIGSLSLAASNGSGPADCTRGAGPGKHCVSGAPGLDGMGACVTDADCGGGAGTCALDANCFFGPPAPVPLDPSALSSCAVNVILRDVCGSADLLTGATSVSVSLSVRLYLAGG